MAKNTYTFKADILFPSKAEIKTSGMDQKTATKAFTTGALRASNTVEQELPGMLLQAMESPVWGPFRPKEPYFRKNGEVASVGKRDLIDTGRLHDSMSVKTKFLATKSQTVITYRAPYARLVHEGGVIQPYGNNNAAAVILPARPWIRSVLQGDGPVPHYNYRQVYQNEITNAWSSG